MEPDYKADTIKGKQRAYKVEIFNPDGLIPSINFSEELVVRELDEVVYQKDAGHATDTLIDPSEIFDMVDPVTGDVIGQMTYQDYYVMTYSVYRHVAAKRDAIVPAVVI